MKVVLREDIFTPEQLAFYQVHPIEFIEQQLLEPHSKADNIVYFLSDQQRELILSILHNKRTAASTGRGLGKTAAVAFLAIWFDTCFERAYVLLTAPSAKTLYSGLFTEVKRWLIGSNVECLFECTSTKIYYRGDLSGKTMIEPRTATKDSPEAMSGLHSPNQLFLIEEASRVPNVIHRTLINSLTDKSGNNKVCEISNPTRNTGYFYDIFHNDRLNLWSKFTMSTEDSPFADKINIRELVDKWGEDHDIVKIDVRGEFPSENEDTFIPLHMVYGAFDRNCPAEGEVEIGIDPARMGRDKAVWMWRYGNKVFEPIWKATTSVPELVDNTLKLLSKIRNEYYYEDTIRVKIDVGNIGGALIDYLKLKPELNIEVVSCNFGGAGDDRCANEASIMWNNLRDVMNQIDLPSPDDKETRDKESMRLLKEEVAGRRADYKTGRIRIERKDAFKEEYGRSPDYADALVLLFYGKKADSIIARNFNPTINKDLIRQVAYTDTYEVFSSIFYSKSYETNFVVGKWGDDELVITKSYRGRLNPQEASTLVRNMYAPGYRFVVANDACFSAESRHDIRSQLRRHKLRVRQVSGYNEEGAIELMNNIIDTKRLRILATNDELIQQMHSWKPGYSRVEMETRFGLCYSLIHLIYSLRKKIERTSSPMVVSRPYESQSFENDLRTFREIHERAFL